MELWGTTRVHAGAWPRLSAPWDALTRVAIRPRDGAGASWASRIGWCAVPLERVQQVLSACGRKINTAFVERLNLDIRQRVAAVGRRVHTLYQGEDSFQHQLVVVHA